MRGKWKRTNKKKLFNIPILIQFMKFNTNIILVTTAVSRFHCYCWCCCTTIRMPTTSMDILVHHTHNNRWAVQFQANWIGKTRPNETEREIEGEREGLMAVGKRIKNRRNEKLIDSAWHSKLDCCDTTTIRVQWDVTAAAEAYRWLDSVECEPMPLWVFSFYWEKEAGEMTASPFVLLERTHYPQKYQMFVSFDEF